MKTEMAIAALAALAQESRLAIFRYLVEAGPAGSTVGSIADALDLPAATLSFHLKELTRAALLDSQQEGRFIRYAANFATMNDLIGYLTENRLGRTIRVGRRSSSRSGSRPVPPWRRNRPSR